MAHQRRATSRTNAAASSSAAAAAFEHFVATAPVMICALDDRGRFVAWNDECRRATGFALDEIKGAKWNRLFPDAKTAKRWSGELAERRHRRFRNWTWEIRTMDGERRVISWNAGSGRPPVPGGATWAIGTDTTEFATAEESLRAARDNLSAAQSAARIGVWSLDPETGRVWWSPEQERLLGFKKGSFGGRFDDFLALLHPDDRAGFLKRYREQSAKGDPDGEAQFRVVRPDGAVRFIRSNWRAVPATDGAAPRIVGTNLDVTSAVEAAVALKEKDEYLRVALQSTKLVILRQDRRLRYTWVANPGLGFSEREVLGHTDADLLPPDEARMLTRVKRRILRTGNGERLRFWLSRGERRSCFEQIMEPEFDSAGRVVGLVAAAHEITDVVQAQQELEEARRDLQRLAAHLQDKVEDERRSIAQDVHDQVGSVLTGIRMALSTLTDRLPCGVDECREEVRRVAAMTDQAAAATRAIALRLRPPTLEDIGLAETCRWYLRDWAHSTGLRIKMRLPKPFREPRMEIAIDVFRSLQELIANVARHAHATTAKVSLRSVGKQLCLSVQDDGHGFDVRARTRGFGLAGLRERAAHHGGTMTVQSGPGGTKVTLCIPRGDDK